MDLDYERTERVQFEDDDYYYFVKAVPKKMVTSTEKTVKQFGQGFWEKRNERKNDEMKADSKKLIAEELDIDEDLLD